MAGGLLGCLGAWAAFQSLDMYTLSRGVFIKFEVTPHILASGILISGMLGVISCLAPAYATMKMSVVSGLKTLD
jgi:hypothetical protein